MKHFDFKTAIILSNFYTFETNGAQTKNRQF